MSSRLSSVFFGLAIGLIFNAYIAFAWTGPTASAPNNNVSAPVNVGSTAQVKSGDFGVNNFSAFGNALFSGLGVGTGRYLNFDYTSGGTSGSGSSGYGFRDNAGVMEYKNSGGTWASFASGGGGSSPWTVNGSSIYYNAGNVGIGTANPSWLFTILGINNNWTEVINYPSGANSAYGILIGHSNTGGGAGRYSQFENQSGVYVQIARADMGLNIHGIGSDTYLGYNNGSGWGLYTGAYVGAGAFFYLSDKRLKENVMPIERGLEKIMKLNPVSFTWNSKATSLVGKNDIGLLAQEVQKIQPEIVQTNPDGYLTVDYAKFVPVLIKAIQEQQVEIEELKTKISALEARK